MNSIAMKTKSWLIPAATLALTFTVSLDPGSAAAQEDTITIGLYAPTTPIGGPSQRLELINSLASHLSSATGKRVTGRAYNSAGAFSGAVKKGAIQFAVVDAPYAAARRQSYKILAAAVRSGRSTASWQLVASSGVQTLADLKSKAVAVPQVGAKVPAFVSNVLLEGEVDAKFFRKIDTAPNPNAAATMVSTGRVAAAFVPEGTKLPAGVSRALGLRAVGLPLFVAVKEKDKNVDDQTISAFGSAVKSFSGQGAISGFGAPGGANYSSLVNRFGKSKRDGIMVAPRPARLAVRSILENRSFVVTPSDIRSAMTAPVASAAPSPAPGPAGDAASDSARPASEAPAATPSSKERSASPK